MSMTTILQARYHSCGVYHLTGQMEMRFAFAFPRLSAEKSSLEAPNSVKTVQTFDLGTDKFSREWKPEWFSDSESVLVRAQFLGHSVSYSSNERNPCQVTNGTTLHIFKLENASYNSDSDQEKEDETVPEDSIFTMNGGIELQNVPWGEFALSIAREVLLQKASEMEILVFKITSPGKIAVRLRKLAEGPLDWEAMEEYAHASWKRLKEENETGKIPADINLEVVCLVEPNAYEMRNGMLHDTMLSIDAI